MTDATQPTHYQGDGMQAIDAINAAGYGKGFNLGNVIKYVWRFGKTGKVDDLRKARQYLDFEIAAAVERDNQQYRMETQRKIQELAK